MSMQIVSLDELNAMVPNTAMASLGMVFTGIGSDWLSAKLPVDARTKQTHNVLHGGVSVVMIESLGSIGAQLSTDRKLQRVFGMEVNANHLRAARTGFVHGRASPIHLGRTTQVWEARLTDDDGKLTCIGRLTVAVVDAEQVRAQEARALQKAAQQK